MNRGIIWIGILFILFTSLSMAEEQDGITTSISRVMTYQGLLKDNAGDPVSDGVYNLIFRLYTITSGLLPVWMSPPIPVQTTNGYFSAEIGPIDLSFNETYYISVQVQGDAEMSQKQKITAGAYSLRADTAEAAFNSDLLDGQHASAFAVVSHNHDAAYVNEGQANSINTGMIIDGTILLSDIGQNGATNGQVLKWNGSAWIAGADSLGNSFWHVSDSVFYTNAYWGIVRGGAGNLVSGITPYTYANFGAACTTGTDGIDARFASVFSGYGNRAGRQYSSICGGYRNKASGDYSFIGGGESNYGHNNTHMAIAGGKLNETEGAYSFIGAGERNHIGTDIYAAIVGGYRNEISAQAGFIGSGYYNTISGINSVICAGVNNTVSGDSSALLGGSYNTISGNGSVIGGGSQNSINANFCAIPSGSGDTLDGPGNYSFIFGRNVYNNNSYRVVFFDSLYSGSLNINRDNRNASITSYPIQIGCSSFNGNGAYLTNAGVWTNASSRTFKENFTPFTGEELLSKIANLSITTYNYKNTTEKHVGPVAEEFVGAFDTGVIRETDGKRDDMYLSSGDVAGVALAGVQELLKEIKELKFQNAALEKRISDLENR
jgi:hypothetical protein